MNLKRFAVTAATGLVASGGLVAFAAAPAQACVPDPNTGQCVRFTTGTVKASPTLNVRSGPGTGYTVVGSVAFGTRITIDCYRTGTTVTATWPDGSTWTTNVWDHLIDGPGYVSDAWVDTGGPTQTMVPAC